VVKEKSPKRQRGRGQGAGGTSPSPLRGAYHFVEASYA